MTLVETIKEKLPIAQFVAPYTGGLVKSGPNFFIGQCPFHQSSNDPNSTRKFWVNTKYNICGCFVPRCAAYCNRTEDPSTKPLDIINFWSMLQDVSIPEAIAELEERL